MDVFDIAVIGQGYAGLVAANAALKKGRKVVTFEAMFAGGFVMNVNHLDPAPEGGENGGADLVSTVAMENMDLGVKNTDMPAETVVRKADHWEVTAGATAFKARDVIVASGRRPRKLGLDNEDQYLGRGLSECADCDGPMYGGQKAVVVGGGDSAFQEALTLAAFGADVTLLVRGETPKARAALVDAVHGTASIEVKSSVSVTGIEGDDAGVTGVRVEVAGTAELIPCRGIFVFIGGEPVTEFLPETVALDDHGAIVTDANGLTTSGLYAIGSVRSGFGGLLTHAADDAHKVIQLL